MLQDIKISRFEEDPQAQGVIRPADGRWQLVIDKDGYPHLYVQVYMVENGEKVYGMFCVEDMMIEKMSIRDLMDGGEFGAPLAPEEMDAAHEEFLKDRVERGIPCPRDPY